MCASHVIGTFPSADEAEDALFEMANLFPGTTGLPMTVWVSPRGGALHDLRVKVNMTHGNQMSGTNTAVVGVSPTPRLITGRLGPADRAAVFTWIALNIATLMAHRSGKIDTKELGQRLKRLG